MSLKISRILHAGYVFEHDKTQIIFDPIFENPFSQNCFAFPNAEFDHSEIKKINCAAVFISHYHDDHFSLESLKLLPRSTPIYIYCRFDELLILLRDLGFEKIHTLEIDAPVQINSIVVTARRAVDEIVDSIFHIQADELNILNVVDSWLDSTTLSQLSESAPWDMILWPFQTLRETDVLCPRLALPQPAKLPQEWIEQLKKLKPRFIVPSSCQFIHESWSWYNQALFPISYRQFQSEVESALPQSKIIRMNPSVSFALDKNSFKPSAPLAFVKGVGLQNVDYEFDSQIKPPPTSDIAKNFPQLSELQTKRVLDFCRYEIVKKYQELSPPADFYFEKVRYWRLMLYDHKGNAQNFDFEVLRSEIKFITDAKSISWTTEISMYKLYQAIENGEALTSLYLRINDMIFAPEIEKTIATVDILEDPLVRCLFSGQIGSYQKAQLKKILQS